MTTFSPRSPDEVTDAIRWALAAGEPLDVGGAGSKRTLGRPASAPHRLDVSGITGIVNYEPAELILTARPGTPMVEIEAALAQKGQCLAFEPPGLGALLRSADADVTGDDEAGPRDAFAGSDTTVNAGTLGGAVATGFSGPRRVKAGAARDHVLGIAAVSGRGEAFVGGGKVVKNVTGYDIPKLLTGSHGTLAVLTEITLKVLPASEDVRTLLVHGLGAQGAVGAMAGVQQSAVDASGLCHLPAGLVPAAISSGGSVTAFRLEGVRPSVEFRLAKLRGQLEQAGSLTVLDRETSIEFWRGVRDVAPFAGAALSDDAAIATSSDGGAVMSGGGVAALVWRLSVPPAEGARVLERIERAIPGAQSFLDWGGGLIWVQCLAAGTERGDAGGASAQMPGRSSASTTPTNATTDPTHSQLIRAAIGNAGGHALLMRAPGRMRATTEVFHPQPAALAALSKRVKAQFDPARVLNPGRMYAEI